MYYPGIYDRDIDPEFFYPAYISTFIERDVRQIKNIENLIITDLIKSRLHKGIVPRFYYWQNKTKQEVDLIIDTPAGPVAYEIKSGMTMNDNYFTNLRYWQKLSGEKTENLNVIYGGDKDLKTSRGNYISWKSIQKINF